MTDEMVEGWSEGLEDEVGEIGDVGGKEEGAFRAGDGTMAE